MPGTGNSIRVLHVDDETDVVELAAEFLEREDDRLAVETETNPTAALETLAENSFDCVVSDHDMPQVNGIELLERIRDAHPNLPFILYTGKGSEEVASEAISMGATDYLQKRGSTEVYELLANRIIRAVEQTWAERDRARVYQALETATQGIGIIDAENRYAYVNEAYAALYGREPADLLGSLWEMLYPEEEAIRFHEDILPALEQEGTWTGRSRGQRADGSLVTERLALSNLPDGGHICVVQNITDRIEREAKITALHEVARELERCETPETVYEQLVEAAEDVLNYDQAIADVRTVDVLVKGAISSELSSDDYYERTPIDAEDNLAARAYRTGESSVVDDLRTRGVRPAQQEYMSALTAPIGEYGVFQAVSAEIGFFDETDRELTKLLCDHASIALDRIERRRDLEQYERIVEHTPVGIFRLDHELRIVYENPRAEAIVDVPEDEPESAAMGEDIRELQSIIDAGVAGEFDRLADGEEISLEFGFTSIYGAERHLRGLGVPLFQGEEFDGAVVMVRDQADQKERQWTLQKERDRIRALFENNPQAITEYEYQDGEPLVNEINPEFERAFGCDSGAVQGRPLDEFTVPEEYTAEGESINDQVHAGEIVDIDVIRQAADGLRPFNLRSVPLTPGERSDRGFAIYTDISERKDHERELERYRTLVDTVGDPMYILDSDGAIEVVNRAMSESLGATPEDLIGIHTSEVMGEGDFERGTDLIRELLHDPNRDWDTYEITVVPVSGEPYPAEINLGAILDADGEYRGSAGVVRDLTERKAHERELERYATTVKASGDPIYTLDEGGHFTNANAALTELAGYDEEELVGEHASMVMEQADVERGETLIRSLLSTGAERDTFEMDFHTADGDRIPCENHLALLPFEEDFRGTVGVLRDISDRLEHERQLTQLHERTGALMEPATKDATARVAVEAARDIIDAPLNGVHLLNEAGDTLLGSVATEQVYELFDELPEYERNAASGTSDAVTWAVFEKGEPLYIEDTRTFDPLEAEPPTRTVLVLPLGEHGVFIASSREPDDLDETDRALMNTLATSLTTALDRVDHERILQRERDRLDEFAGVVSHDLRNPLNVVQGRLELASEDCKSDHLDAVARAAHRMETLIADLLELARAGEAIGEPEPVVLADLVAECWGSVETPSARLVTETEAVVQADRPRLRQLLENLFRNAVEHGSTSSRTASDDAVEHGSTSPHSQVPEDAVEHGGQDVTVTVGDLPDGFYIEDTGPGIPKADREQVFDAGHTTNDEGTGFGLSIVAEIAEAHGWSVRVTSGAEGGARFEIIGVETGDT